MKGSQLVSFTIGAVAGVYAPEVLYLNAENDPKVLLDLVAELTLVIEALPAGAQLELDLLKVGGNSKVAGDWLLTQKVFNAAGLQDAVALSEWYGARLRAKSGGAAGAAVTHANWF